MVITARTGFFVWLLAITGAAAIPVTCAISGAAGPCVETLHRVYGSDDVSCPAGAHMETTEVAGTGINYAYTIVKCTCPRATPDAGAR